MTQTQHTPENWQASFGATCIYAFREDGRTENIPLVRLGFGKSVDATERQRIAALIASAPQLLADREELIAALKDALERERELSNQFSLSATDEYVAARSLLSRMEVGK